MSDTVIKVENVSKKFCRSLKHTMIYGATDLSRSFLGLNQHFESLRKGEFWAVKNVSFEIKRGETLGIIGPNGSGKSTILKMLNGIFMPDRGKIEINGRIGALIEVGAGFHPMLTGRANVYINGAILGMSKKEIDKKFDKIVEFSELREFIDSPVKHYSSGMYVRLGFAIAIHCEPDILLVDDILAVGDIVFQRKCLQHMTKYIKTGGTSFLVSHNMHLIQSMCNKCLFLNKGKINFHGNATQGINAYYESNNSTAGIFSNNLSKNLDKGYPAAIEKVDIFPTKGDVILAGESVRVIVHYRSDKDISGITWSFSIWTGDQWIRITTCTAKYSIKKNRLFKGEGHLSCTILYLPLVPGTYALKAGIYDLKTSWPIARKGWEDAAICFSVKSSGKEAENRHVADGDLLLSFDIKWD